MLEGRKILVTGATSQVALPVVAALAPKNEVHGLARLKREADREKLTSCGVRPHALDLATDALDGLPDDFDTVLHFAVVKSGDFDYDLRANAEGVGRLMSRCRNARAFLHCSSAAVYQHVGHTPVSEDAQLGDNHRALMPTYSLCKIAAESVVRFAAREWNLPTTIARLSVPYGSNGGWPWIHLLMMKAGHPIPVHPDAPNLFNPIHEDDYVSHVPRLLEIAAVPATVLNWGGEPASIEEWTAHMAALTGLAVELRPTAETIASLPVDRGRMRTLLGTTRIGWREGIRRMLEARAPELLEHGR